MERPEAVELLDLQYHDVRPDRSLYERLVRAGKVERLVDEADVRAAMTDPPETTRAYFRGTCLARWADSVVAANWDSLVLDVGSDPLRRIPMMEPTRGSKEHVAELFAEVSTPRQLVERLRRAERRRRIVMPEREHKQKPAPKEREEEVVEEAPATSERGEKLKEDIDDLSTKSTPCSRTTPRSSFGTTCRKGGE